MRAYVGRFGRRNTQGKGNRTLGLRGGRKVVEQKSFGTILQKQGEGAVRTYKDSFNTTG